VTSATAALAAAFFAAGDECRGATRRGRLPVNPPSTIP